MVGRRRGGVEEEGERMGQAIVLDTREKDRTYAGSVVSLHKSGGEAWSAVERYLAECAARYAGQGTVGYSHQMAEELDDGVEKKEGEWVKWSELRGYGRR